MLKQTLYKYRFWLLILIFLGPWAFAWWMFHYAPTLFGVKHTGTLISPPYQIGEALDRQLRPRDAAPKWLWITFETPHCDSTCQTEEYQQYATIHKLLNNKADRIQRLHLTTEANHQIQPTKNPLAVQTITVSAEQLQTLQNLLPMPYISILIDPLDFAMMVYDKNRAAQGILKDLKRLLKVSQIG